MLQKRILTLWNEMNGYSALRFHLEKDGYEIISFNRNQNILEETQVIKPDLILLDLNVFERRGLDVCQSIRNCSSIPIIVLSECDEVTDKIEGLNRGADDYIAKPFSPLEVMARIRALLRRYNGMSPIGFACRN
jgi:DNA-binding response OmpR family regulator